MTVYLIARGPPTEEQMKTHPDERSIIVGQRTSLGLLC